MKYWEIEFECDDSWSVSGLYSIFIPQENEPSIEDIKRVCGVYPNENGLGNIVRIIDVTYDGIYFEAVETCPHCDGENAYPMWDVDAQGYMAICQHCGKEIFLCDECIHAEDELNAHCMGCDWCETECGGKCFRGVTRD